MWIEENLYCRVFKSPDSITKSNFINVLHHRAGQPTEPATFPWHGQLILRIFNFITIKQGIYIYRTRIWFRRYLSIFFTRARVMPSPTVVPIAPDSWLGSFLITTTTSLLGPPSSHRSLCSHLGCYLTILYSTTLLDLLTFASFPLSYYY
jgi:hypothetical protein